MKKLFLLSTFLIVASITFAQKSDTTIVESTDKYIVETNRFWDNWYINLGGGAQLFWGDHSKQMKFMDMISPAIDFSFGKWFSPGLGVRASVNGLNLKGVSGWSDHSATNHPNVNWNNYQGFIVNAEYDQNLGHWVGDVYTNTDHSYPLYKTNIEYINTHVDALFNLTEIFFGHKPNRVYSFIPYIGVGWATTLNEGIYKDKLNQNVMGKKSNEVTANGGVINRFRLNDALALDLELRATYVNDRFDQQIGGRYGEGIAAVTLGLTYKFNNRNWNKSKTTIINEKDIQYIEQEPKVVYKEVEKDCEPLFVLLANVTFDFDEDVITDEAAKILDDAAEILKSMPENRFLITGYTDIRGGAEYNRDLSARRAAAVAKGLEDRGVPSNMLKSRGVGKQAASMPYEESHEVREGDRKVTIELITNMTYWDKLPKTSY